MKKVDCMGLIMTGMRLLQMQTQDRLLQLQRKLPLLMNLK